MILDQRAALSSYATRLLSEGRAVFSREEAQEALGIKRGAFLDAAERLQKRNYLFSPRRGFYVIVPPQYLAWEAPPPSWYIDPLMRHEGRRYYVGLLKAAELHGASHQAVMEFQVVADKQLPRIKAGRSVIAFYYRKDIKAVSKGIEERKTDTGHMNVSSVELTVLDLLRYPQAAGGLDNIATILSELGPRLDAARLATLARGFERSVIQRLGHLLDRLGHAEATGPLHKALLRKGPVLPWIELERSQAAEAEFVPEPVERDERWHVIVRRGPEPEE
jgi:predicted transcriptional regulator of viral defense system